MMKGKVNVTKKQKDDLIDAYNVFKKFVFAQRPTSDPPTPFTTPRRPSHLSQPAPLPETSFSSSLQNTMSELNGFGRSQQAPQHSHSSANTPSTSNSSDQAASFFSQVPANLMDQSFNDDPARPLEANKSRTGKNLFAVHEISKTV